MKGAVEIPVETLKRFMRMSEGVAETMYNTLGNGIGYLNERGDGPEEGSVLYEKWRSTESEMLQILDGYGISL